MKKIYTVHDIKAEAYLAPFFVPTAGLAIRTFAETCNTPDHDFSKYPEDYTLMELGDYDETTGLITAHPAPIAIGKALDFVKAEIDLDNPGKN